MISVNPKPALTRLESNVEENLVKKLMTSVGCSTCGHLYQTDNIAILGHEEDLWFLNISCPVCQNQYLMAAITKKERAPEFITDLNKAELEKFSSLGKPTSDDILDTQDFLKDFDGDFSQLFSDR